MVPLKVSRNDIIEWQNLNFASVQFAMIIIIRYIDGMHWKSIVV